MNDERHEPLAERLRRLRTERGLSVADVAALSNVRRVYLEALEEGRFHDLPEDVFAMNFVRLYAQALGVDAGELLAAYRRDRRGSEPVADPDSPARRRPGGDAARPPQGATRPGVQTIPARRPRRGGLTWGILAAIAVLAVGAWQFDVLGLQARTTSPTTAASVSTAPPGAVDGATATEATTDDVTAPDPPASDEAANGPLVSAVPVGERSVTVQIVTEPPGATISVDGFPLPGSTPITTPVTARAGRVIRAELEGFLPTDVRLDLLTDARIALTLDPEPTPAPTPPEADAESADGGLTIVVNDAAWLEIFRSSARNEGERLVYTTATPGSRFVVEPPVFVFSGNAGAVELFLDGVPLGTLGNPGQVTGRAIGR